MLDAGERVLAQDIAATRTQPPFTASAMDGYAVKAAETTNPETPLKVIGEVAAGYSFDGTMQAGEALRIFTGAPVPNGADAILIQENARRDGDNLYCQESVSVGKFIRPAAGLRRGPDTPQSRQGTRLPRTFPCRRNEPRCPASTQKARCSNPCKR